MKALIAILFMSLLPNPITGAESPREPTFTLAQADQKKVAKKKRKKKKRKKKKRKRKKTRKANTTQTATEQDPPPPQPPPPPHPFFGIGLNVGWEATYGNGLSSHFFFSEYFDGNLGVGYNNSGAKAGGGANLHLPIGQSWGFFFGGAFVFSQGRSGTINLDAHFQPEGSSTSQAIQVEKDFTISPATLVSGNLGYFYRMTPGLRFHLEFGYNHILSGNEVTLGDQLRYSDTVEVTNEDQFNEEFNRKAKDQAQPGGPGISASLVIFL